MRSKSIETNTRNSIYTKATVQSVFPQNPTFPLIPVFIMELSRSLLRPNSILTTNNIQCVLHMNCHSILLQLVYKTNRHTPPLKHVKTDFCQTATLERQKAKCFSKDLAHKLFLLLQLLWAALCSALWDNNAELTHYKVKKSITSGFVRVQNTVPWSWTTFITLTDCTLYYWAPNWIYWNF